jgi:HIV Tat-specific factor 1
MLDGTKVGDESIKVEPAKFEQKQSTDGEKKQLTQEQRRLLQEKKKSLSRKLTDWDDDGKVPIVVVKNMFRPNEYAQDKSLQLDIQLDIQDECRKLGIDRDISKIAFDQSRGNVTIEFKLSHLSKLCIKSFDGRYFDGLKLSASFK